jgi:hypothetical protein
MGIKDQGLGVRGQEAAELLENCHLIFENFYFDPTSTP